MCHMDFYHNNNSFTTKIDISSVIYPNNRITCLHEC